MGDTCCTIPAKPVEKKGKACPQCNNTGKKVKARTLHYMVKGKFQTLIVPSESYFFCSTTNCPIVYYSSNQQAFTLDHIRLKVGQKETQNPQACYCFNFFNSDISEEIKAAGKSTILDFIKQKVKENACACEIMNPSGKCCLGNIERLVKKTPIV